MKKTLSVLFYALLVASLQAFAQEGLQIRVMALFLDKAVVSVDGTQRLLSPGNPSPEGVLLVAADSSKALIEVNGRQQIYRLGSHIQASYRKPESLEARIWQNDTGSYTTTGSINGRSVDMLVDTGATSVAMNGTEAKRLGIRYRVEGRKITVNTASGEAAGYAVTLSRVKVGGIEFRDIEAVVVDGDSPKDVLLGMTFLKRVSMENQGRLLTLRTRY